MIRPAPHTVRAIAATNQSFVPSLVRSFSPSAVPVVYRAISEGVIPNRRSDLRSRSSVVALSGGVAYEPLQRASMRKIRLQRTVLKARWCAATPNRRSQADGRNA